MAQSVGVSELAACPTNASPVTQTESSDNDQTRGGAGSVTMNAVELIETQYAP